MSFVHPFCTRATLALLLLTPGLIQAETQTPPPQVAATAEASLDDLALSGKIAETMSSNGYTYLLLDSDRGKIWVAIPETQVKVGQTVTCQGGNTMFNFTSKTLNRTFDRIIFSPGLSKITASAPAAESAKSEKEGGFEAALRAENSSAHGASLGGDAALLSASPGSTGAIVPSAQVNVNKATGPNSYAVGECFEQGKNLQGKTVRVRGKVMKISRMIMGKNWVHLQDGTGNPLKNQHDLVFTTATEPKEGEVVTLEGILAADRDFGAGYKYAVIVEDAKIVD